MKMEAAAYPVIQTVLFVQVLTTVKFVLVPLKDLIMTDQHVLLVILMDVLIVIQKEYAQNVKEMEFLLIMD